tara:strand:+ start:291 stop:548 length:258 start_codon:yes stop_codon:yes gene_type:complete
MPFTKESVILDGEKINFKGGALRSQLKVPEGINIPKGWLRKINNAKVGSVVVLPKTKKLAGKKITATPLLKRRVSFGMTLMKMKR